MRKFLGTAAAVGLLALSGAAFAQNPAPAPILTVNPSVDLVPFVPNAQPRPAQQFTLPAYIAGAPAYVNELAVGTGAPFTFPNGVTNFFIQPTGTLAAVTITTAPNPVDGQRECFLSTQTTTSLTITANTGQTINNAPTAGVANTPICWTYMASKTTWYRSP